MTDVEASAASDTKVCPACAESVKAAALVCRYCGHQFADNKTFKAATYKPDSGSRYLLKFVLTIVIGGPILAFAIYMASEAASDTEYYASSIGLSISECREVSMRLGDTYQTATDRCMKRVPKK